MLQILVERMVLVTHPRECILDKKTRLSQDDSFSVLGDYMGSEESDRVMTLLQELAMLKEADVAFEANPTESEVSASRTTG
jgi:hypothetical protein